MFLLLKHKHYLVYKVFLRVVLVVVLVVVFFHSPSVSELVARKVRGDDGKENNKNKYYLNHC